MIFFYKESKSKKEKNILRAGEGWGAGDGGGASVSDFFY